MSVYTGKKLVKKIIKIDLINIVSLYFVTVLSSIVYYYVYNPRPIMNLKTTIEAGILLLNFYNFSFNDTVLDSVFFIFCDFMLFFILGVALKKTKRIGLNTVFSFYLLKVSIILIYVISSETIKI